MEDGNLIYQVGIVGCIQFPTKGILLELIWEELEDVSLVDIQILADGGVYSFANILGSFGKLDC